MRDTNEKCWSWITYITAFVGSWSAKTRTSIRTGTVGFDMEINLRVRDCLSNGSRTRILLTKTKLKYPRTHTPPYCSLLMQTNICDRKKIIDKYKLPGRGEEHEETFVPVAMAEIQFKKRTLEE